MADRLDDQIEGNFFVFSSQKIQLLVIFKTNHFNANGEESVVDPNDLFMEENGPEMELKRDEDETMAEHLRERIGSELSSTLR
jgi:hypothetical protein